MARPLKISKSLVSIAIMLFASCSKEYNPFSDYSNARIAFAHQSIHDNDTIDIFCTETLSTMVLAKELIDSFIVRSPGNRLWHSPDSTICKNDFKNDPFEFLFSFGDTGHARISFSVYKLNGDTDTCSFSLFVKSPLHQSDVMIGFGDSLTLKTPPVADKDVNYFWSFGAGIRYSSRVCSTTVAIIPAVLVGKGGLWVSDGFVASRIDTFNFLVRDTAAPSIVCVNENFVGKDTVYTGDSVFNFKVRISNRGDQWVDSASIDKRPFDRKENKVYYSLIDKMYTHDRQRPLQVRVFALSHFQNGVPIEKPFTLIFSPDIVPGLPAEIKLLMPSKDSMVTLLRRYAFSGTVENHSFDSLNLFLTACINDSCPPAQKAITGNRVSAWDWSMDLSPGPNKISFQVNDEATLSMVHRISLTIIFADTANDSAPPSIIAITANGEPANNFHTDKATVKIGVKAFDEVSGIDTLTVNGRPCKAADSGSWYYDSIPLRHARSGNEVVIRARDRKNNDTTAEAVIFRNRLPVIQKFPVSSYIAVDSLYKDTLRAFDPDMDTIVYEKTIGPSGFSIDSEGAITWRPTLLDTGNHSITLRLWDGYQPVFYSYTLYVFGNNGSPGQVRFATKAEDFPSFLQADKDTLRMTLRVASGVGIRPILFSARIANKGKIALQEGTDSLLVWAPQPQDTGFIQLVVSVKDAFPSSDTLYPRILVVPQNRPCSLTVRFSGDTTSAGALNLNKKRGRDTLTFTIKDPDNPLVERHDLQIIETRMQLSSIIDSAVVDTFSLVVDPIAFDGFDTIIGIVRDRAGFADTLKQKLYYGMPPYSPQALFPNNLTSISGDSVSLSWQDADPDGDSVTFDVYLGIAPDLLSRIAVTPQTSFTATELSPGRTYYWRITAHDWKSFTESPIWQFSTR